MWIPDAVACLRWAGPLPPFSFTVDELPALLAANGAVSTCLAGADGVALGFGQHVVGQAGAIHLELQAQRAARAARLPAK
jgi:ribosomal-protein-alanine N-acetyltransferase